MIFITQITIHEQGINGEFILPIECYIPLRVEELQQKEAEIKSREQKDIFVSYKTDFTFSKN